MPDKQPATAARQSALQVISAQVCVLAVVVVVAWLGWDGLAAKSASLGGLASVIPGAYFAWRVFARVDARAARQMVRAFYINEFIKLMMSVFLVIAFVNLFAVSLPAFFIGFVLAQLGFWLSPLFDNKQTKRA